jgi:hypothetical protein
LRVGTFLHLELRVSLVPLPFRVRHKDGLQLNAELQLLFVYNWNTRVVCHQSTKNLSSACIIIPCVALYQRGELKAKERNMDEGRKRVIGIMASILASLHMQTADDLFGGPQGSPRTDKLIAASVQWAEKIMEKIDERFSK